MASPTRTMLTSWDGSKFPLLSHAEIAALPTDDRRRYEERLHGYDLDNEGSTDHYARWVAYRDRCAEPGCTTKKYDAYKHCLRHVNIDDVESPEAQVRRRSVKAQLRLAEMLEGTVDELEKLVMANPDELAPAVRLKAIDSVLDRASVPRQTAASVDHSGNVNVAVTDVAAVISGRLDRLASSMLDRELTGIEEATVLKGEIESGSA